MPAIASCCFDMSRSLLFSGIVDGSFIVHKLFKQEGGIQAELIKLDAVKTKKTKYHFSFSFSFFVQVG